jgi:hypothetical protein
MLDHTNIGGPEPVRQDTANIHNPTWPEGMAAAKAAQARGATKEEIQAAWRAISPGRLADIPAESRQAVLDAFAGLGLPADAMPDVRHALAKYEGQNGKLVISGRNDSSNHVEHVMVPVATDASRRHCLERLAATYQKFSKENRNIGLTGVLMSYNVPERSRGLAEDAVGGCSITVDLDDGRKWEDMPISAFLTPTIIGATGGPGHTHNRFHLDKFYPAAELAPVIEALVKCCGADKTHSIEHEFRVLGSTNYPDAKKRAKGRMIAPSKLVANTGEVFTLQQIIDVLRALGADPEAIAAKKAEADAEFDWDTPAVSTKKDIENLPDFDTESPSQCAEDPK